MKSTYRIVETNDKENRYVLVEVTEHENGRLSMPEDADLYGDNIHHMKREVEMMMRAFERPVLKKSEMNL